MNTRYKIAFLIGLIVLLLLVLVLQEHTFTGRAISAQGHQSLVNANPLKIPHSAQEDQPIEPPTPN